MRERLFIYIGLYSRLCMDVTRVLTANPFIVQQAVTGMELGHGMYLVSWRYLLED